MKPIVLMIIPDEGRYEWVVALQFVVFVPKGHRRALWEEPLSSSQNTLLGAKKKAHKLEEERVAHDG